MNRDEAIAAAQYLSGFAALYLLGMAVAWWLGAR